MQPLRPGRAASASAAPMLGAWRGRHRRSRRGSRGEDATMFKSPVLAVLSALAAAAAPASELPSDPPSWTVPYVGANAGYARSGSDSVRLEPTPLSKKTGCWQLPTSAGCAGCGVIPVECPSSLGADTACGAAAEPVAIAPHPPEPSCVVDLVAAGLPVLPVANGPAARIAISADASARTPERRHPCLPPSGSEPQS